MKEYQLKIDTFGLNHVLKDKNSVLTRLVEQSGQLKSLKLKQIAELEEHTGPFT